MPNRMSRLQTLINEDIYIRGNYCRLPDEVKYMLNYILLEFDDSQFREFIRHIEIIIHYATNLDDSFTPEIQSISIGNEYAPDHIITMNIDYNITRITIKFPVYLYAVRGSALSRLVKLTLTQHTRFLTRIRLCTIGYATGLQCTTISYFTVPSVCLSSVDLQLFQTDIENGVERYLRSYLVGNRKYINEILQDSIDYQYNDLTMTILRICEEEGLRSDPVEMRI